MNGRTNNELKFKEIRDKGYHHKCTALVDAEEDLILELTKNGTIFVPGRVTLLTGSTMQSCIPMFVRAFGQS